MFCLLLEELPVYHNFCVLSWCDVILRGNTQEKQPDTCFRHKVGTLQSLSCELDNQWTLFICHSGHLPIMESLRTRGCIFAVLPFHQGNSSIMEAVSGNSPTFHYEPDPDVKWRIQAHVGIVGMRIIWHSLPLATEPAHRIEGWWMRWIVLVKIHKEL